jgi:hypothetical protein
VLVPNSKTPNDVDTLEEEVLHTAVPSVQKTNDDNTTCSSIILPGSSLAQKPNAESSQDRSWSTDADIENEGINSAIPLPASINERNEAQMSVARKLEIANIKVFKDGVGPKVDTISSLGYTPTVRGSLVFQDLKPKAAEVIQILDDDVHQEIIELLDDHDTNLKHFTTSVTLETESGERVKRISKEAYWKKRLKRATIKNCEATNLLTTRQNEAS